MKIIYLHGCNSIGLCGIDDQRRIASLRETFGSGRVSSPDLPFDPGKIITLMDAIAIDNRKHTMIFIGNNLGAFYAHYFARKYFGHAVVINPMISPSYYFSNRIGEQVNDMTGEAFTVTKNHIVTFMGMERELTKTQWDKVTVFLSADDPIMDPLQSLRYFEYTRKTRLLNDGGHSLLKHWDVILEELTTIDIQNTTSYSVTQVTSDRWGRLIG